MTIKILTLLFFTSLMNFASAVEDTQSAKAGQPLSLRVGELPQTLAAEWVSIIDAMEKENALLQTQLWKESSYLWLPPVPKSSNRPKGLDYEDPNFYKGTGVEFVQKIFADLSNTLMSAIDELERENHLLNDRIRQLKASNSQIALRNRNHDQQRNVIYESEEFKTLASILEELIAKGVFPAGIFENFLLPMAEFILSSPEQARRYEGAIQVFQSENKPPLNLTSDEYMPTSLACLDAILGQFMKKDILFTCGADEEITVETFQEEIDNLFQSVNELERFEAYRDFTKVILPLLPKVISLGGIIYHDKEMYLSLLRCSRQDPKFFKDYLVQSLQYKAVRGG
jgi:hypothetical protein